MNFLSRLYSPSTTVLMQIPDFVTPEDKTRLRQSSFAGPRYWVRCYEAMVRQYGSHPFFVVRLAENLLLLGVAPVAERMLREVKTSLGDLGIEDTKLNETIELCSDAAARKAKESVEAFSKLNYTQIWRPSREHKFPIDLPLPDGHEEVRALWANLLSQDEDYRRKYLVRHAIDTNHVEYTFLLDPSSVDDLVRRGVDKGDVALMKLSRIFIEDYGRERDIIRETASGYDVVLELANEPQQLSRQKICDTHVKIMETCRFPRHDDDIAYVPPGETRTATWRPVTLLGRGVIVECCPYMSVDQEVDFICDQAKEYMRTRPQNPFAIASWLHLLLAQCHPFNDGNGRVTRMIASVPLIMAGYPMINIDLDGRAEYHEGIRRAHEGDHAPLIKCFFDGMRKTLEYIQQV